jgi:hypothetical protein
LNLSSTPALYPANESNLKYSTSKAASKSRNLYESVLTINDLNGSDLNKTYECEAINELGSSRVKVELVSLSKPEKPNDLRALFVNFMMIQLTWSPGFDGGIQQEYTLSVNGTLFELSKYNRESGFVFTNVSKLIQVKRLSDNLVNIINLDEDQLYELKLIAKNQLGSSEWSDELRVKTTYISLQDVYYLPTFDSLFLNVPKNRLEFSFKPQMTTTGASTLSVGVSSFFYSSQFVPASGSLSDTVESHETSIFDLGEHDISSPRAPTFAEISSLIPTCLNISSVILKSLSSDHFEFKSCLPVSNLIGKSHFGFGQLNKDDLLMSNSARHAETASFKAASIKSLRVSVCFHSKQSICTSPPSLAIIGNFILYLNTFYILIRKNKCFQFKFKFLYFKSILKDTYNTISHSSIVSSKQIKNKNSNKNENDEDNDEMSGMSGSKASFVYGNSSSIPVALVIGICVCILSLLVLLFVTVIYCIRKRNFKLCKALLSAPSNFSASNNNAGMSAHGSIGNLAKQIQMESSVSADKLKTL